MKTKIAALLQQAAASLYTCLRAWACLASGPSGREGPQLHPVLVAPSPSRMQTVCLFCLFIEFGPFLES